MYSLVVVLSLLASASFVLAFVHGRRGHLVGARGVDDAAALHARWGLYLAAAMACAWIVLWRRGRVAGRDGLLVGGAVLAALRAMDPDADRRRRAHRGAVVGPAVAAAAARDPVRALRRDVATPLLAVAVLAALRAASDRDGAIRVLAGIAVGGGARGLARLAGRARVGEPLLRGPARPAGARARGDPRARRAADRDRARRRRGDLARSTPRRGAQQRAHRRRRGHARDPPRRRRRLHPARAGAGALALPAERRALRDPARDGLRRARDRLAQRPGPAARRPAGAATCCRCWAGSARGGGSCS